MLQKRVRDITQGLFGRLLLSRSMQVRARRKSGVMLREQTKCENIGVGSRNISF